MGEIRSILQLTYLNGNRWISSEATHLSKLGQIHLLSVIDLSGLVWNEGFTEIGPSSLPSATTRSEPQLRHLLIQILWLCLP